MLNRNKIFDVTRCIVQQICILDGIYMKCLHRYLE